TRRRCPRSHHRCPRTRRRCPRSRRRRGCSTCPSPFPSRWRAMRRCRRSTGCARWCAPCSCATTCSASSSRATRWRPCPRKCASTSAPSSSRTPGCAESSQS
ncbi:hypothetical protein IWQ56_005708, partial [Coemansia nantahalensis]